MGRPPPRRGWQVTAASDLAILADASYRTAIAAHFSATDAAWNADRVASRAAALRVFVEAHRRAVADARVAEFASDENAPAAYAAAADAYGAAAQAASALADVCVGDAVAYRSACLRAAECFTAAASWTGDAARAAGGGK